MNTWIMGVVTVIGLGVVFFLGIVFGAWMMLQEQAKRDKENRL